MKIFIFRVWKYTVKTIAKWHICTYHLNQKQKEMHCTMDFWTNLLCISRTQSRRWWPCSGRMEYCLIMIICCIWIGMEPDFFICFNSSVGKSPRESYVLTLCESLCLLLYCHYGAITWYRPCVSRPERDRFRMVLSMRSALVGSNGESRPWKGPFLDSVRWRLPMWSVLVGLNGESVVRDMERGRECLHCRL
jgi:hypothetical protein